MNLCPPATSAPDALSFPRTPLELSPQQYARLSTASVQVWWYPVPIHRNVPANASTGSTVSLPRRPQQYALLSAASAQVCEVVALTCQKPAELFTKPGTSVPSTEPFPRRPWSPLPQQTAAGAWDIVVTAHDT